MNLAPQLAFIDIQSFDKEKLKLFFENNLFYKNIEILSSNFKNFNSSESKKIYFNYEGGIGFSFSDIKTEFDENFEIDLNTSNVLGFKLKSDIIENSFLKIKDKVFNSQLKIYFSPLNVKHYSFISNDLLFQVYSEENDFFLKNDNSNGGVNGIIIGVENTEKALDFYNNVLQYDKIIFQEDNIFSDFKFVQFENIKIKRTIITQSEPFDITHNNFFGNNTIELIEVIDKNINQIHNLYKYKFNFFVDDFTAIMLKIQKLNYKFQLLDKTDSLLLYDFFGNEIYIHKLSKQKLTTFFQEIQIFIKSI